MTTPNVNALNGTTAASTRLKMHSSSKGSDGARKPSSPVDGGQRKPQPQKAWQGGANPFAQRAPNPNNSNGVVNPSKTSLSPAPLPSESPSPMKHLNDRMIYLLAHLTGHLGNITLKNGEKYTGVLSGTSLDPTEMRYVFKMVKKLPANDSQANGSTDSSGDYVGDGDSHVMAFDAGDVAHFHVPNVDLSKARSRAQNGASSGFRTDTDISGNAAFRERNLQRWEPAADTEVDHSLESTGGAAGWDQFSTNEQLFGVKSDYDESIYTTTINRNDPKYAERVARADMLAREIEASSALNAHIREERGVTSPEDKDMDEEAKYSGVRRDYPPLPSGGTDKYTPPARRPPSGQPTVPGAPVDPAIISSQIARPDPSTTKPPEPAASTTEKGPSAEPPVSAAAPKPELTSSSGTQTPKDVTRKPDDVPSKPPAKPKAEPSSNASVSLPPAVPASGNAARNVANVETALLESFKHFSAAERQRIQTMATHKQQALRESKAVRLNDLKKFSQNFKLKTPIPTDLIPILAKDETKQKEIVEKAHRAALEKKPSTSSTASLADVKALPGSSTAKPTGTQPPAGTSVDRHQAQRPRQGQAHYGSASMRDRSGPNQNMNQGPRVPGLLSQRLTLNQHNHKQQQGTVPYNMTPQPIPAQDKMQDFRIPTGPSAPSSGVPTPTSSHSKRFNAHANEFRPNPAAHTFQPGGNPSSNSSPRPASAAKQEPLRKPQVSSFLNNQRPSTEALDFEQKFNALTHAKKSSASDGKSNGFPPPYRTAPTWAYPEANQDRSYRDMFETPAQPSTAGPPTNMHNGPMQHQHQLPLHLQGPQVQSHTPHQANRHPAVPPHHGPGVPPQFEAHNMQYSHSTSSVHPSPGPRPMAPYMYGTQPQPMAGFQPQAQVPPYGMSPVVPHAGLRPQGGHQFINPPVPTMGGHMMTNQPSNGPYMGMQGNVPVQMYPSAPAPNYPHYPNQMGGPPAANGYSPTPRAPMMHHQGSQQGHQPMVYMPQSAPMFTQMPPGSMPPMRHQPFGHPHHPQHFNNSPQQHHQFPQQPHRGTPSGTYAQPMVQQHSMPPQAAPPSGPSAHGQDTAEEVK